MSTTLAPPTRLGTSETPGQWRERILWWALRPGESIAEHFDRCVVRGAVGDDLDRLMCRHVIGPGLLTEDECAEFLRVAVGLDDKVARSAASRQFASVRAERTRGEAEEILASLTELSKDYLVPFLQKPERRLTRGQWARALGLPEINRGRGASRPLGQLIDEQDLIEPAHSGLQGYGLTAAGLIYAPFLAELLGVKPARRD